MKVIELKGVSRKFGNEEGVEQISLQMEEGGFLVLFGEDDAGKTTLLHILMGFDMEYNGQVQVLGKNPADWGAEERSLVRFVSDGILLEEGMTGENYLEMARAVTERYDAGLEKLLCQKLNLPIQEPLLSMTYQENKLIQITAAVCAKPVLLILDEPANFLGKKAYSILLQLLDLWNKAGMSILLAAEHYKDAEGFGKSYAYLREGKLIKQAAIKKSERRQRAVTVMGKTSEAFQGAMAQCISKKQGRKTYLYNGKAAELLEILNVSGAKDFLVEELTLEEELSKDYARWK